MITSAAQIVIIVVIMTGEKLAFVIMDLSATHDHDDHENWY